MLTQLIAAELAVVLGLVAVACTDDDASSTMPANSPSDSSWRMILPLGSGGHPDEPGSNDSPKWMPGKLPVTMQPILAFNGDLWMTSQTNAWSSSNGRLAALHKDRHGKPHLGRQAILQGSSVVVRRYGVQPARAGQ